jgi:hypothetical protein
MKQDVYAYRAQLHRERAHRGEDDGGDSIDYRDSFTRVYLSSTVFLAAEYVTEASITIIPSGLIFPLGFLIFWAVYYTYYKPTVLEAKLFFPERWNWKAIPTVLLGVAIWFVKVTLSDLGRGAKYFFGRRAPAARPPLPAARPVALRVVVVETPMPREVLLALQDLGLQSKVPWEQIQHRYRALAKRYHPDLNPEITRSGTRFMRLDSAYRRLAHVKHLYFGSK